MPTSTSTSGNSFTCILHQVQGCLTQPSYVPNTTLSQTTSSTLCRQCITVYKPSCSLSERHGILLHTYATTHLHSFLQVGVQTYSRLLQPRWCQCSCTEGSEYLIQAHWWKMPKWELAGPKGKNIFILHSAKQSTNVCPLALPPTSCFA